MNDILTIAQAYEADQLAAKAGIESYDLMLRAGAALAQAVMAAKTCVQVQVLCGPGANGGDGYVAAKVLREAGRDVAVFCLGDPDKLTGDAQRAYKDWNGSTTPATAAAIEKNGMIIDALFGAGLSRVLEGDAATLVTAINESDSYVVSADLPSGVFGDNGAMSGPHVRADETVTFFRKKTAHVLQPACAACGVITVADIGIPVDVLDTIRPTVFENNPTLWPDLPPTPSIIAHKHTRGHLLVRCGDALSTGAARLAARAGLRAGAGLVTLLADDDAAQVCATHETEVMVARRIKGRALGPHLRKMRVGAAVIGPAGGVDKAMREDVGALRSANIALALDADGLSAFADAPDLLFAQLNETCVLTPHEGEFARLFPDLADRAASKVERVRAAAERANCVVVLKGPDSVIAAPDGCVYVNTNACAYLATAGSGDVLAGIIGALLAQGVTGFEAAVCGVWLHGAAGALCGRGLIAGDLTRALPEVLQTQL